VTFLQHVGVIGFGDMLWTYVVILALKPSLIARLGFSPSAMNSKEFWLSVGCFQNGCFLFGQL